jgi:hypothetical protein
MQLSPASCIRMSLSGGPCLIELELNHKRFPMSRKERSAYQQTSSMGLEVVRYSALAVISSAPRSLHSYPVLGYKLRGSNELRKDCKKW